MDFIDSLKTHSWVFNKTMTAEFDSYGNLPYQWKKTNTEDSNKWITEVPNNSTHEETHSETASSPQSSSGTIGSDVVSNSSPESHTPIVSPVQSREPSTDQFEASTAEGNIKQNETAPTALQEYSELKVDIAESKDETKMAADDLFNLPEPDPSNPPTISIGAKFTSFAHFESIFEPWKQKHFHPFRVASSETMRHPDGQQDPLFRYRYIVYHCVHYGTPRMRGNGKRPNQSYLPSGCKAMLRLNFSYNDNSLRITTLHTEHQNHEIGPDHFCGKIRKISPLSEVNRKKDSPRSIKSSQSSKPSPATTQSSQSQMPSFPTSPNVQNSSNTNVIQSSNDTVPKQDVLLEIPSSNLSLATMLAAAYGNNNTGNTFSMFQASQPCIVPQQIPIVNNNSNNTNNNSLAALLSQKENFSSSGNGSTQVTNTINPNPPLIYPQQILPNSQQFPSIQDIVKHRDNSFSSLLGQQQQQQTSNEHPLAKLYEAIQKQTLQVAIEQYRMKLDLQSKLQARNEEYRTIMNLLNNGNIPLTNLNAMDRILALLRQVVECVHTSN